LTRREHIIFWIIIAALVIAGVAIFIGRYWQPMT